MTLDLNEIRAACEKATPGPWRLELVRDHYRADSRYLRAGKLHLASFDMEENKNKQADGEFCAQARTWVPALLARVEALEGALREIGLGRLASDGEPGSLAHYANAAHRFIGIARHAHACTGVPEP